MNKPASNMYDHYPVKGTVKHIPDTEANAMMQVLAPRWEALETPLGTLYTGVYDWACTVTPLETTYHIPKLRTGGSVPCNITASKVFKFPIFGDCFLQL
jgi:hypothetical protein